MSKKKKIKSHESELCLIPLGARVYVEGAGQDDRHRPIVRILGISHGEVWSNEQSTWTFSEGSYTELVDKAPGIILGKNSTLPMFWMLRTLTGSHPSGIGEHNPGLYVYRYQVYNHVGSKAGLFDGWSNV